MKVTIELQYFEGCPHSQEAIKRVKETIMEFEGSVKYKEVLIETQKDAELYKFRGSPTILINGKEIENMPAPEKPHFACRYYKNGLPTVDKIKSLLMEELEKTE